MNTMTQPRTQTGTKTGDCGCGCEDCKDKDNATQVSINVNRTLFCQKLYTESGVVSRLEKKFDGENDLYKEKRCIFLNTEKNYRRYRNFEITTGTELIQTNVSIKASVTQIKEWNKTLNTTLNTIFKQVKDLKAKFGELKDASCKLDSAFKDKCNIGQKKAITGKGGDNCPDGTPIDACTTTGVDIEALICRPKGLAEDIDSVFQASSDVIGIQIFSNIDSLDQLQIDLSTKSSAFDKLIGDTMKTRKTELDKMQDDLVNEVKIITQAAIARNAERAIFKGYYDTTMFLCCPSCSCVPVEGTPGQTGQTGNGNNPAYSSAGTGTKTTGDCGDCPPRLKDCEQAICDICDTVKTTFCCTADTPAPPTTPPATPPKNNCD